MEKLVKRLLKTKAVREVVERPPVKPDKNGGNGREVREYFPVFHMNTMRECRIKIWWGSPAVLQPLPYSSGVLPPVKAPGRWRIRTISSIALMMR